VRLEDFVGARLGGFQAPSGINITEYVNSV
jgi:hypothetical protein